MGLNIHEIELDLNFFQQLQVYGQTWYLGYGTYNIAYEIKKNMAVFWFFPYI